MATGNAVAMNCKEKEQIEKVKEATVKAKQGNANTNDGMV